MHLASAPNLFAPAYLTIIDRGYTLRKTDMLLFATKDADTFIAGSPILLLGVIAIAEARGEQWTATDEEIDRVLDWFSA